MRRRGGERIAAVAGRAAARIGPRLRERYLLADHDAADGESAAEAFTHEHDVGHDVVVLDREHLPGPSEPRDHFVADEQGADFRGERAQLAQVTRRGTMLPAVPWIGSTMIAAMSLVVSSAILERTKSTQCH